MDQIAFLNPGEAEVPVVVVTETGSVIVFRPADGTVAARGDLGKPSPSDNITAIGERLYVSAIEDGRTVLSAYSIEPVRRLWRAEGGPAGPVTDCGEVLCVPDGGSLTAVDPADGRPRWTRPGYLAGSRYGADRIFADRSDQGAPAAVRPDQGGPAALLDAATGRPWLELGDSRRLGEVILRTDRDGRVWVSVPDARGTPRVAGPIGVAGADRCTAVAGYLAGPIIDGRTVIWRLPETRP